MVSPCRQGLSVRLMAVGIHKFAVFSMQKNRVSKSFVVVGRLKLIENKNMPSNLR